MSAASRKTRWLVAAVGVMFGVLAIWLPQASAAPTFGIQLANVDHNEVQAIYVEAGSGEFRLLFGEGGPGEAETADIPVGASAALVESSLNALSNISDGGGSVSVRLGTAESSYVNPYIVTFSGGPLALRAQPLMRARAGTAAMTPSLVLGGGPAMAYVETRIAGGISRSDERIDYAVQIKNVASANPSAGDTLTCDARSASWFQSPTFSFKWLRDGNLASPVGMSSGGTTSTYVVQGADAGHLLQCVVLGTNAGGAAASFSPPISIEPVGAGLPSYSGTGNPRPLVTGTGIAARTCTAPTSYPNAPTWSFQWLRNGVAIAGATSSSYAPVIEATGTGTVASGSNVITAVTTGTGAFAVGQRIGGIGIPSGTTINAVGAGTLELSAPATASAASAALTTGPDAATNLQCAVTGQAGGGGVFTVSNNSLVPAATAANPAVPNNNAATAATIPFIEFANATSGTVTAELELPAGAESFAYMPGTGGTGWTCSAQPAAGLEPAKAICTRSESLSPGGSYPVLNVAVGLGADAPESTAVKATVSGGGAATAASAIDPFTFDPPLEFGFIPNRFQARALGSDGQDYTQAGGHPTLAFTTFPLTRLRQRNDNGVSINRYRPVELMRNATGDIPAGFIGNPQAVPELCSKAQDLLGEPPTCPPGSVVGELGIQGPFGSTADGNFFKRMVLYAMEPEPGVPAQFAAAEPQTKGIYVLTPRLRPEDGYAISVDVVGTVENPEFFDFRVKLCGYGANVAAGGFGFRSCKQKGDPGAFEAPFLTSQTECASPGPVTKIHVDSWLRPADTKTATAVSPKMTGCGLVPFTPALTLAPTSKAAESASGLDVSLTVPTDGLEDPDGTSQAHLKKTTVTLPKGMSLNPGAADGLAACTQAQLGMVNGIPNNDPVQCPNASKIGTAVVKTPILKETLEGGVYLGKQGDHPFPGDIAALYVVAESKERGVLIKLPGRVEIRPGGQIVSTFDDNPQAPFSSLELSFNSGPRGALMTPQRCGSYEIVSELTPWSAADPDNPTPAETVTQTSKFDVTSGPGGSACPTGAMAPKLKAGITGTIAGESSPFVLSLSRGEGTQRFNGLTMSLPPGLSANLSGVPYCSDATLASIPTALGTGQAEINNPSCPAASRVGSVSVGAGAGNPYYVSTGSAYLAGPYKGAPLSLAVVIPAVAGPFDLGNVVVRNAAFVDPRTAQVSIKSDPLPTHVHNLPVDVRDVRVTIDKPGFMRAPTNCEEMRIDAVVSGEEGGSAPLSNRFQVGECGSLEFGPKLKLEYKGQTKRTGNPALRAVLTQPAGQANIANTQVILPKGSFIDNAHINNPCTRAEYAANACPAKSILGRATAWSPLLDEPLSGNVYFRSNGGERELPDIVAKLQGQVEVELVGYIDSIVNKKTGSSRVRNTFAIVPDAPVSRFVLQMKGGKLGLIENSKNLCKQKNRATVKMGAHNGLALTTEPVVKTSCGKKKNGKKRKK